MAPNESDELRREIAERKRTEAALRESEGRYRLLAENVTDVIWVRDLTLRATYISPSVTRLRGYSVEEAMAQSLEESLTPASRQVALKALADALAIAEMDVNSLFLFPTLELEVRRKDGSTVWTETTATFLRDPGGRPISIVGVTRDISRRKRMEDALRAAHHVLEKRVQERTWELEQSNARYQAIFASAMDCIITIDHEGRITEWNPAAEQTFGHARSEVIGKLLAETIVPPSLRERHTQGLARYLITGEGPALGKRIEMRGMRADGTEFPVELSIVAVRQEGHPPFFTGYVRDISERKDAEELNSKLAALVESSNDAIIGCTLEGAIASWNSGAEKIYGYSADEVKGRPIAILVPPERAQEADHIQEVLERGDRIHSFETVRKRKDGQLLEVSLTISPIKDAARRITGYSAIARDITDRKRVEREVGRKNRELETLLYVTSHDLREPLRAIENFSNMINDRYANRLDEKGQDFLGRVVRGAKRMNHLLDDIVVLSRAQRIDTPIEETEGDALVREAFRLLENRIKETGGNVLVAKGLPKLRVSKRWATQAVYNLLGNALKFTEKGAAPEVEIAPYHGDGEVGLAVRDRGPGVAPEHAERIFQLFQRGVGREIEGTGAGLAIVRRVAEWHGGRAWVQPREGGGSEFIITFGTPGRE